jgi:branched-chain amino acid transport system substrate-binding protein
MWTSRLFVSAFVVLGAIFSVASQAAETLKIGVVAPISGSLAEAGKYGVQGAQLATERINANGGVLGRSLELVVEDDQSTNPGAVFAFSRLVSRPDIVAIIGPTRSTQIQAIAPDVLKGGKPVMIGGTDPRLTKAGNPWLFRFRPNDTFSARVMAKFGLKDLGRKKWAVIRATDAFGMSASQLLVDALAEEGVTPVLVEGQPNNSTDYTPVTLAVKQSGADVIATFITFEQDLALFARQLRQQGVTTDWVGSPSTVTTTALKLAGPALYGTYAVADFNADASPEARAFADEYAKKYTSAADFFSSWPYDALNIIAAVTNKAGKPDPDAIRSGILAVSDYRGVEGVYRFDESGDGLHGYNIVRNDKGKVIFDRHIEFER